MKRLWIITELFPPDETSTSFIMGEIANACTSEYEVHVICGPEVYDSRKKWDVDHPFLLNQDVRVTRAQGIGIDKNTAVGKARAFVAMSRRLFRLAKKSIRKGDKVLLVTNPAPLVLLMAGLRKRRNIELNVLVHDVFPENTVPAGMHIPGLVYRVVKSLFDRAYARADRLIAIGRDMASVLRRKAGESVDIRIVENWADTDIIQPLPFPEGPVRLEYAGNIGRVQGLDRLVSELPDNVELHFYGTGAMEDTLKAMGKPNVYFHGPYFRSQQQEVIGTCHAAIVTLADGMYGLGVPSKSYNIMAAGRPIVYFGPANGEIGMMLQEHGIGYLGWPSSWDIDELKRMGERARALAEDLYSKPFILNKFLNAIR